MSIRFTITESTYTLNAGRKFKGNVTIPYHETKEEDNTKSNLDLLHRHSSSNLYGCSKILTKLSNCMRDNRNLKTEETKIITLYSNGNVIHRVYKTMC